MLAWRADSCSTGGGAGAPQVRPQGPIPCGVHLPCLDSRGVWDSSAFADPRGSDFGWKAGRASQLKSRGKWVLLSCWGNLFPVCVLKGEATGKGHSV